MVRWSYTLTRGESLLDPGVAARTLDQFSSLAAQFTPAPTGQTVEQKEPSTAFLPVIDHPRLTTRELEVLRLMQQGARNKEIATALVITERTVKIHVGNILTKLNARFIRITAARPTPFG